jgi:hypothetical protein
LTVKNCTLDTIELKSWDEHEKSDSTHSVIAYLINILIMTKGVTRQKEYDEGGDNFIG